MLLDECMVVVGSAVMVLLEASGLGVEAIVMVPGLMGVGVAHSRRLVAAGLDERPAGLARANVSRCCLGLAGAGRNELKLQLGGTGWHPVKKACGSNRYSLTSKSKASGSAQSGIVECRFSSSSWYCCHWPGEDSMKPQVSWWRMRWP